MNLYLDTSLVVSAWTRELRSTDVVRWLGRQSPDDFLLSEWVVTEFSSALALKLRTGQIDQPLRAEALARFNTTMRDSFTMADIAPSHFRTAAKFADHADLGLRSGDALHLAICAEAGATLCTLDQRLATAAPVLGVAVVQP